jgi:hypothetical protein
MTIMVMMTMKMMMVMLVMLMMIGNNRPIVTVEEPLLVPIVTFGAKLLPG